MLENNILTVMESKRMTRQDVSDKSRIPYSSLTTVLKKNYLDSTSILLLLRISEALEVDISELWIRKKYILFISFKKQDGTDVEVKKAGVFEDFDEAIDFADEDWETQKPHDGITKIEYRIEQVEDETQETINQDNMEYTEWLNCFDI